MDFTVVKATEWTYPDRLEYRSASSRADLYGARGSFAEAQLVFAGVPEGAAVSVRAAGGIAAFETEWYELVPVYVEGNLPELNEESRDEWIPSRAAPFWIYDCAKPLGARVSPKAGGVGLYAALRIPAGAEPGVYEGVYEISLGGERFAVPVSLQIYAAQIPEEEHL